MTKLLRAKHLPKHLTEKPEIKGVSKDEPRVVNEHGGSQSRSLYDFTLADPKAMFEMCKVLKEGADKYGADNWRLISIEDHLNHLLIHTYAYLAGDKSDDHLSHIMCRALFAQGVAVQTAEDVENVRVNDDHIDTLRYPLMASDELPVLSFTEVAAGADLDGDVNVIYADNKPYYVNIDDLLDVTAPSKNSSEYGNKIAKEIVMGIKEGLRKGDLF